MVEFNCFVVFSFPETWNIIRAVYYVQHGIRITRTDETHYHSDNPLDKKLSDWKQAGYRITVFPMREGEAIYVLQAQPAETRAAQILTALIEAIGWQANESPEQEIPSPQQSQIDKLEQKIDRLTTLVEQLTRQAPSGELPVFRTAPPPENHDDLMDALEIKQADRTNDRSVQNFLNSLFNIQNMFRSQKPATESRPTKGMVEEPEIEVRMIEDEEEPPIIGGPKAMDVPQFDAPSLDDFDDIEF